MMRMVSPPKKLNIGVVGLGRMGQRHALNIMHRVRRARLHSVCSVTDHEIQWAREHLEVEGVKIFINIEEMIRTPGLEAVIISSPTALHIEHTLSAIHHGIHVLCEKPVTTDLAQVSLKQEYLADIEFGSGEVVNHISQLGELIDVAATNPSTKIMVGFVRRFDEEYRKALRKIQEGAIGEPIIVRSQGTEKLDKSGFFLEYARHSGGIFVDTVVHDIDLTLSFLGENVRPKALWATGLIAHHHEMAEFNDADNAIGVVEFWNGKIAYYYHSRTTSHGYDNCTEVVGKTGKISINLVPHRNRVQVSNASGIVQDATPDWIERYQSAFVTELEQFTESILEDKELPLRLTSAYTGLQIALALQESLTTGQKIDFGENGIRKAQD